MMSNFEDILNGMIVCFSSFKDTFDTHMMNIICFFIFYHNLLTFSLSESCKSLHNRRLFRFCHIWNVKSKLQNIIHDNSHSCACSSSWLCIFIWTLIILIFLNCLNLFWTGIWLICSRILLFHFFLRCSCDFFLTTSCYITNIIGLFFFLGWITSHPMDSLQV